MQLTCRYNASPPVSIVRWKINGTVTAINANVNSNDSRIAIPHYNESQIQLTISTTTSQDAGNYTCNVTNDLGSSSDTTVIVIKGVFLVYRTNYSTCSCLALMLVSESIYVACLYHSKLLTI